MKRPHFTVGAYYHIYNRGTEKRSIILDAEDQERLLHSLRSFNRIEPIQSLYALSFETSTRIPPQERLVEIVSCALMDNHYHLLLQQKVDGGISEFIKRVAGGYAWYFNNKYERSGSLFQGKFKASHLDTNEKLLRMSAYINRNDKIHGLSGPTAKYTSWEQFVLPTSYSPVSTLTSVILDQFSSIDAYIRFTESVISEIVEQRKKDKEEMLLLEDPTERSDR